ncbi:MAG: hypothetical protein GF313_07655 [Caldithrix sp.]|nr:hypothetical protein [Caldithrix sp.]
MTKTCNSFKDLIDRSQYEHLIAEDASALKEHLNVCRECRKYQALYTQITKAVDTPMAMDHTVRNRIKHFILDHYRQQNKPTDNLRHKLLMLFGRPIPLYQSILLVLSILIIFIYVSRKKPNNDHAMPQRAEYYHTQSLNLPRVLTNGDIKLMQHQMNGINMTADTMFSVIAITDM